MEHIFRATLDMGRIVRVALDKAQIGSGFFFTVTFSIVKGLNLPRPLLTPVYAKSKIASHDFCFLHVRFRTCKSREAVQ